MKIGSSFPVPAKSDEVFRRFLDPDTMAACIPGCEELVRVDERTYKGRLVNEIAHVRFNASFAAEIQSLIEPREVRAVLKGEDRRLASSLKLDALLQVEPNGNGSEVTYEMEIALWGKLGRMGESIFRRRTAEVEQQFVQAFTQACTGVPLDQIAVGGKARARAAAAPVEPAASAAAPAGGVAAAPAAAVLSGAPGVPVPLAAAAGAVLLALGWILGRCTGARR